MTAFQDEYEAPRMVIFAMFYIVFLLFVFAANLIWDLSKQRTWWVLFWILIASIVLLYKTHGR